jgi:hypothetical protein
MGLLARVLRSSGLTLARPPISFCRVQETWYPWYQTSSPPSRGLTKQTSLVSSIAAEPEFAQRGVSSFHPLARIRVGHLLYWDPLGLGNQRNHLRGSTSTTFVTKQLCQAKT